MNTIGFNCSICLLKRPMTCCSILKQCQHGFCDSCIRRWFANNQEPLSCPDCRSPAKESDLSPVFLDIVVLHGDAESQTQTSSLSALVAKQATYVSEKLGAMDASSAHSTVLQAGREIDKVAKAVAGCSTSAAGNDGVTRLLKAVEDFKTRIAPMYEQLTRLDALQRQYNELESKSTVYCQQRNQVIRERDQALEQRERLNKVLDEKKSTLAQREGRLRILTMESMNKDTEIRRLTEAYRDKEDELANYMQQARGSETATQSSLSSPVFTTSELGCVDFDSDEGEEAYPTPTSPSVGAKARLVTKTNTTSSHPPEPAKKRPKFLSDWNLDPAKKRKTSGDNSLPFPLKSGRPTVPLVLGSRKRLGSKS